MTRPITSRPSQSPTTRPQSTLLNPKCGCDASVPLHWAAGAVVYITPGPGLGPKCAFSVLLNPGYYLTYLAYLVPVTTAWSRTGHDWT